MSFFRFHILITPFVLFLPLYYVLLPFPHSDYSFCVSFAIVLCPSSIYTFWLLLLCYFCHCIMSFFRLQIMITPFVLFLPLYYVLLPFTNYDYSLCVIFAIVLCPSSVYTFWLLLLCYFCHCIMSFFRLQIMITPFVLFLPLYYVLLPFTNYDYSFCVIFAIVLCPSSVYKLWLLLLCYFCHCIMSFFRLHILITPFVLFLPLYYVLLPFTNYDYSFCVIFAIVLCPSSVYLLPSSVYTFWLLLLTYFCCCSISFFRIQILITPFVLFLQLYYVLLLFTNYDYSFCVIFAIVLCRSSVYKLWLLPLCYFCHCIMSFFRLHILITPFVLFLPLYYVLLPFTNYDYSFCVIFAIVLCPSSVYKLWLLLLCYFCHCIMSFFRLQIIITPFVLFLPLYYVLLPFTHSDYSFCVIFAIVLCHSSVYKLWLLLLCYFCHCIMSFFRLQIMITPFVLFLPLYYVLLPFTNYNYSFCDILPLYYVLLLFIDHVYSFSVIFAIAASPSSEYRFWLLLLSYFCHCIMSFFRLQIMITPFVLVLPLYYVLLPFPHSDYSFCVIFAIVLCPSSVYTFWLLLLTYFCHCSISFFRIQILITPFVLFLPLYYVLLLFTDSDYSFCVIFATAASPSSGYRFWLFLLCYFCHCIMSFFRLQIMITPFVLFCHCIMSFFRLQIIITPFVIIFAIDVYSFSVIFAIAASFFRIQILITPFVLFLPLYYVLLPFTNYDYSFCVILPLYYVLLPFPHSDYSFCVIFAIVLCPSSVYTFWLLLLTYFCHCSISFFRIQILITPFVLFLPLYYVLLLFTDSDYSFCVIFATAASPSSGYRFWLFLLCYFCHCIMSFFRLQIMITPFVLFLPLYYVLLPFTHSDYSFCVIFAIVLCPSSVYRFWLLLLCYFCHCIMSFFRLQITITPFVLFLPLYYVLLPFTHSDYSFCVMFAIVLCPSSVYKLWLLLLCYFCHCIMSFFRLQIMITPFVLFLPLYYVLLPFTHSDYSFWLIFAQHLLLPDTDSDYSFCVIFAIVLCPSSVYRFWLLFLSYFCHCSISFFRVQIITPFVLFLPLYYVLLLCTDPVYSFCVIFAIVLCPSSVYKLRLLLLCYFCHCIMSFFRLQIMITPFVLFLPLYYVLLPFTNYDYSFCVIFAIVLCPSSVYTFWLLILTTLHLLLPDFWLLLCYFCNCIMSFFCLQILITPFVLFLLLQHLLLPDTDSDYSFVLFLPLYYVLLLFTDSDYSFWVIFATAASPSSGYRLLLLLC